MQHSGKISFPNVDKRVAPISFKPKIDVDSFQHQVNVVDDRAAKIDMYYNHLQQIIDSKKHSGTQKVFKKPAIDEIYRTIFDTSIPKGDDGNKNNLIDKIVDFYTNHYVSRNKQSMAATGVGNVDTFITSAIPQPAHFDPLAPTQDEDEEEDFY
jgi:hypothetical protein